MKEYKYKINGNEYKVSINKVEDSKAEVEVNGVSYTVEMDKPASVEEVVVKRPVAPAAPKPTEAATPAAPATGGKKDGIKSPLPGVVLDIRVAVGDIVKRGQTVAILEAMKMENNINAHRDGKVTAIVAKAGDSVMEGTDLIIIE